MTTRLAADTLWCLLGVARADDLAGFSSNALEPDQPASVVPVPGTPLACIAAELPADYLVGDAAEARLADPQWLSPRVLAHESALVRAAESAARTPGVWSAVMPARFGTVFSSRDSMTAQVARLADASVNYLAHTRGKAELALRLALRRDLAEARWVRDNMGVSPSAAAPARTADAPTSRVGARYLLERRLKDRARVEAPRTWPAIAASVAERLPAALQIAPDQVAHAILPRPAPPATAEVEGWTTIASWSALVDRSAIDALAPRLDDLASQLAASAECPLRLDWSGPWLPHSFVPRQQSVCDDALAEPKPTARTPETSA